MCGDGHTRGHLNRALLLLFSGTPYPLWQCVILKRHRNARWYTAGARGGASWRCPKRPHAAITTETGSTDYHAGRVPRRCPRARPLSKQHDSANSLSVVTDNVPVACNQITICISHSQQITCAVLYIQLHCYALLFPLCIHLPAFFFCQLFLLACHDGAI